MREQRKAITKMNKRRWECDKANDSLDSPAKVFPLARTDYPYDGKNDLRTWETTPRSVAFSSHEN